MKTLQAFSPPSLANKGSKYLTERKMSRKNLVFFEKKEKMRLAYSRLSFPPSI